MNSIQNFFCNSGSFAFRCRCPMLTPILLPAASWACTSVENSPEASTSKIVLSIGAPTGYRKRYNSLAPQIKTDWRNLVMAEQAGGVADGMVGMVNVFVDLATTSKHVPSKL